jgi:site-specific recombinase
MSASVTKKIEQIESQLGKLKLLLVTSQKEKADKKVVQRKRKDKPASIEECAKKSDLKKFTIKELKKWITDNKIDTKKLSQKHKDDIVALVWKHLKNSSESDTDSSSEDSSGSSSSDSESSSSSESD